LAAKEMGTRVGFGFAVGVAAYAGVNLLRDGVAATRGRGRVQSPRVYVVHGLLGGFIGAALGFYFDAAQVSVVVAKFDRYPRRGARAGTVRRLSAAQQVGLHQAGDVTGGVSLLFAEALRGSSPGPSPPGCSRSTGPS
jgi:cyclic beta-1,2-glucan synthetase